MTRNSKKDKLSYHLSSNKTGGGKVAEKQSCKKKLFLFEGKPATVPTDTDYCQHLNIAMSQQDVLQCQTMMTVLYPRLDHPEHARATYTYASQMDAIRQLIRPEAASL